MFTLGRGEGCMEEVSEKIEGGNSSQEESKIPPRLTVSLVYKLY
jgi:hypothetical protein